MKSLIVTRTLEVKTMENPLCEGIKFQQTSFISFFSDFAILSTRWQQIINIHIHAKKKKVLLQTNHLHNRHNVYITSPKITKLNKTLKIVFGYFVFYLY